MKVQRDTLLGLVFFGGLALLGWATVSLTSLSFEAKPALAVYFQRVGGLRVGDPVYVRGVRMGQVSEVALVQPPGQPPIRVELELDHVVELGAGRSIEIRHANLLGGMQVDIDPGNPDSAPAVAQPMLGEMRPSALEALGTADIPGAVASIRRFFDQLNDPDGSVGALLESREVYDDLAGLLDSARRVVEQIESGEGTLGQLVSNRQMADNLAATVAELREVVHKVNQGKGLIGRLLRDPTLADSVSHTVESLRSASAKLDDPNAGLLGALLGSSELREDAERLVANIADASERIRSGRGLLGKIIYDDELGEKLERVFVQVSGAIEDVREAAPVGSFFQVLAGPF